MATVAKYRTSETLRGVAFPLDLGTDPITGTSRTPSGTDTFTLVMRNRNAAIPTAQTRTITVLTSGPYTIDSVDYDTIYTWAPVDGDFDEAGTYDWVIVRTTTDGDIEIVPSDSVDDFQFEVDLTPSDSGYTGPS